MGSPGVASRYAWFVLAVLTFLNVINFVDRQIVQSLQVPLKADSSLQLNDVKIQLLAGYAFAIVYSIAGLYLGTIADRRHRPRLIAVGLLMWSVATAAMGLAHSYWQLALCRVFVAVGEATLTPAAVAMLSDVFTPRRRSLASGLYYLGVPLGAGLSLIVAGILEPIPGIGWRGCCVILGGLGLVLVVAVALMKDARRGGMETATPMETPHAKAARSPAKQLIEALAILLNSPALLMTMFGSFAINIGVGTTWLDPSWLVAERGFDKARAALFLGVFLLLGGCLGNFLGGWLGDLFHRRWRGGRLLAVVCVQLAIAPFVVLFRFVPADSWLFPVSYLIACISVTMMYGPVLATVQELTPVRMRATMIAILLIGLNVFGVSLGAVIVPLVSAYLESYTWGIFLVSQLALLAIPLFLLAAPRFQTDQASLQLRETEIIT
jgi:MFS family permease